MFSLFKKRQNDRIDKTNQYITTINEYKAKFASIERAMAVIEFNPDGTIIRANENFLVVMGYEAEDLIGKHHRIFCKPELSQSQQYLEHWQRLNHGDFFTGKVERLNNRGESIWLEATYYPVFDENGKVKTIIKFASDITERVTKAEEQAGIIDAISRSMAIIEFNLDGTIITANDNFLKTMNYTQDEIVGKDHKMFCEPDHANSIEYKEFWRTLNTGSFCQGKFKRLNRDGDIIWLEATYQPIYDVKGDLCKVIKFATNVTEHNNAARQAQDMAYQTSMKTDQAVQRGMRVVEDSKQLMGNLSAINTETASTLQELNKQSDQINNIVNTISGIADQTNLLALNAAIEAARAGDQGRGFAVVADEVRQLAGRTSTSTSEIAEVVSKNLELAKVATQSMQNSLLQVESGVELVDNLSSTITEINQSVRDVVDSINQIGNQDNQTG